MGKYLERFSNEANRVYYVLNSIYGWRRNSLYSKRNQKYI